MAGAWLIALAISPSAFAQDKAAPKSSPTVFQQAKDASRPENISTTLEIMLAVTVLSVAPALLVMVTSFTRIVIVLSFVRRAIGTQELPSSRSWS
jgi:flagellar biosynthesis protein FliP